MAPPALKPGAAISGIPAELAATVTRKADGDEFAAQFEVGQLDKPLDKERCGKEVVDVRVEPDRHPRVPR